VRIATPRDAAAILADAGVHHVVTERASDQELSAFWAAKGKLTNDEMIAIAVSDVFIGMSARHALPTILSEIETWKPDVIVRESAEFAGLVAAELHGIPSAVVEVHNGHAEVGLYRLATDSLDDFRARNGLAPDNGVALRRQPGFTSFPTAIDDAVRPSGSPPRFRVRSDPPQAVDPQRLPSWRRTPELPFVYASFGTVADGKNLSVYRAALEAITGLDVEGLLTTGPYIDPMELGPVSGSVTVAPFVPQTQVLAHAAVVLCHGGSGTLIGALAAGKPLVVVPLFADQPLNAATVEATGCGLAVREFEPEAIRGALVKILSDPRFGERAGAVAAEIATLPNIDEAVDTLMGMA
jgi:UDP:flavonoid glycosyltransferase YjiC (YdhE family)